MTWIACLIFSCAQFIFPVGSCVAFEFNGPRTVEIIQHYHGNGEGHVTDPTRYVYIFRDDPPIHRDRWVNGPFLGEVQGNQWRQFNGTAKPTPCPPPRDATEGWFYLYVPVWRYPPPPGSKVELVGPFRHADLCELAYRSASPPWGEKRPCYYSRGARWP